ncbi:MAG: acyl-CoA dehydrogenase family protein [Candidatus Binatus sp.]|uniref:acyl-CoA dehydrogenase family protein n=1 Tax=Candidatus Binatus sp. TaxID=2811406 RepID=UPI00271CAB85|nr:acyl-CoA dehydrogenase family protein [Candidatus Binatus sp.]MDO8432286.1 acyl-CoA dehydrogenase family protein [Candidatus Binatus sp.]
MDFGLSEEQLQLKDSARSFLSGECATTVVRKIMASDDGYPRDLYAQIAKLGWNGLIIPERYGGAGLGMLDMAMLLEEAGYAAMPGPFLFSSVLAASALINSKSDELKAKWLPAIAEGKAVGTVAIVEGAGSVDPADIWTLASKEGEGWLLNGSKMLAPYANVADFIIVAARAGTGSHDLRLFLIETRDNGVKTRLLKNLDMTRRVSVVEMNCATAVMLEDSTTSFAHLLDVASVAIAADSLGGTERALEMAVDYSKVREQFGKPIGSFQALKHAAAEIVADLEPARSLLWYAAYALDSGAANASRFAAMAKARLSEVYSRASDRAVLMHGGIGFTWEHDMHLWFKRARFNESYFGSPAYHRERVASLGGY